MWFLFKIKIMNTILLQAEGQGSEYLLFLGYFCGNVFLMISPVKKQKERK